MKKETIIFATVLALFTMLLVAILTNVASADVDLSQCTVNNQLAVCNQSLEKQSEVVVEEAVVEKKKLTLEDFITELVQIVKERKEAQDVVVISYFEDDSGSRSSILVENQNDMKCVNGICAKEKEWK